MKPLGEVTDQFIKDRNKVYETFCTKKEDGTPNLTDNQYQFTRDVVPALNAELAVLLDEEVDLTPPEKIKEFLLNTGYSPKVGEVEAIDAIIAKF